MSVNSICWNCENVIPPDLFFCQKCNKIQPPKQVDEFKLMGISETFDLDLDELEKAYLKLQQLFHPDKYSQLSDQEIKYSTLLSSMINEAYQKLNSSIFKLIFTKTPLKLKKWVIIDEFQNETSVLLQNLVIGNKYSNIFSNN